MKKLVFSLLMLVVAGGALAQAPVLLPGWQAIVVRDASDGTSGSPLILDNDVYETDSVEMVVFAGGQKAALGTNTINGAKVSQIATLHVDRLDDPLNSGSLYGPYFNIWVTDGLGNYAVLANEPSDAEWAGSRWDVPDWNFLKTKRCKVYETEGWNTNSSWVHDIVGISDPLTFEDVADLVIEPPSPAYIAGSAFIGSGAPDEILTHVAYGYNWIFGDTMANYVSGTEGFVVNGYSATASYPVNNTSLGLGYNTIQDAVNGASIGNAITVAVGIYPEKVHVTVEGLSITGDDEGTVIIDPTGLATDNAGVYVSVDDVTISNLTVRSTVTSSLPRYALKIAEVDGCEVSDVTVLDSYRSGFDCLGSSNLTITDVTIMNTGGHGLSLVDCKDVAITNLTSTGNGWHNVSVATWGRYSVLGTEGIVFSGTNDFADLFQLEMGDYNNGGVAPAGDGIITYSTNPGDLADVTVQAADFGFAVHGEQDDSPDQVRIWFVSTLANAAQVPANAPFGHWSGDDMFIESLTDGTQFYVTPGGSIQAAIDAADPGDRIDVSAGTYVEALLIEKDLKLYGATAGVNKNGYTVPAGYLWDDTVETVIQHPGGGYVALVDIHDTDNVTFDGFVVEELNAVANTNTSLVRVYAHTGEITNINVVNNIIGPNTNVTLQDGKQGRMGLYIINHPYGDDGVVNSTFAGNKIFDCLGNGDNIFLWTSYYAYGAPGPADMTGTVIEDNEIYGSHRAGIETAGGFANLTIRDNKIYGQTGLPADDPDFLKYGHGIQLIRGSSDKVSDPLTAYGPVNLTIIDNEIYGNQKCGIYMGPKNEDIVITDNVIRDNGWNGVMLDLEGNYWNPQFESPPVSGAYACFDCSENVSVTDNEIFDNGLGGHAVAHYGVQLVGTPTNGFEIEAGSNWWGAASGPLDNSDDTGTGGLYNPGGLGDEVTDLVLYTGWLGQTTIEVVPAVSGPLACGVPVTLTFSLTTGDYTPDVFGYNVVVRATSEVSFGAITPLNIFGGSSTGYYHAFSSGTGVWDISGTTFGNPSQPISTAGTHDLFTIVFTPASDGLADITFDLLKVRDPDNAQIPVVGTGATIEVDCTAPAAVTAIAAAPGHNKVDVSWTHDLDDVDHFEVFRGLWYDTTVGNSAYPEYDDVGAITPTRPSGYGVYPGPAGEWIAAGSTATPVNAFTDIGAVGVAIPSFDPTGADRGVYYYEVFAVDAAGNASAVAAANDRATNYWLGDVTGHPSGAPNGLVQSYDITALGTSFGLSHGDQYYNDETDVGPTDDWSRVGIPTTDSIINFEDLIVFSMNFGIVGPAKSVAPISKVVDLAWVRYDDGRQALRLVDGSGVKGVNVRTNTRVVGVEAGELLDQQDDMTFLRNVGETLDVSVAVMGTGVGFAGSGDLFVLDADSPIEVKDLMIKVRGHDNSKLEFKMNETSGSLTPRVFALNPNYPNPFNPMTKISFSLPESYDVRLSVYGIDGRKVATLINETRGPGLHEVVWTGLDDSGRQAASGMYFYRVDAGPYSQVRKMTLMK